MHYDGLWIVLANCNPSFLLRGYWCFPRLVNVLCGKVLESGNILFDKGSFGVVLFWESHGGVASKVLREATDMSVYEDDVIVRIDIGIRRNHLLLRRGTDPVNCLAKD